MARMHCIYSDMLSLLLFCLSLPTCSCISHCTRPCDPALISPSLSEFGSTCVSYQPTTHTTTPPPPHTQTLTYPLGLNEKSLSIFQCQNQGLTTKAPKVCVRIPV